MNIPALFRDEELRRHEFPVCVEKKFFAHAGVCPLPHRVANAIADYSKSCTLGDQETLIPAFQIVKTRELAARLLSVHLSEIAFVGPTSLALSYVAGGLSFERGQNVVAYFEDYPSNVYPWMALKERGVEVRFIQTEQPGRIELRHVAELVDQNTRLVALASNHYIGGWRINVEEIGTFLRGRGILFCLDAIQTVGAFPTNASFVDFLAADSHKWLLGPCAAGILYVRKEVQDQLRPPIYGWHNVACPGFIAQEKLTLFNDSRRYEVGTENLLGLVGLHTSMELILEVGVENIAAELLRKRALLVNALLEKGYDVLNADAPPQHASSIVSFSKPGEDLAALQQKLEGKGCVTSLRGNRHGQNFLRLSPHFYNSDAEIHQLLGLL